MFIRPSVCNLWHISSRLIITRLRDFRTSYVMAAFVSAVSWLYGFFVLEAFPGMEQTDGRITHVKAFRPDWPRGQNFGFGLETLWSGLKVLRSATNSLSFNYETWWTLLCSQGTIALFYCVLDSSLPTDQQLWAYRSISESAPTTIRHITVFERPFVKRFAVCCRTIVLSVLSLSH